MGVSIRKLHRELEQLHEEQSHDHRESIKLFRGQGLIQSDFQRLLDTKNGLLSFNNFFSTSKCKNIAMVFVESALQENEDIVGVVSSMNVDQSQILAVITPFTMMDGLSAFGEEQEVLFLMRTIFRADDINQITDNTCQWKAQLTITSENGPQLASITDHM
ncbi:unnamed protein product [Rotaria socialis]|uniref:Uncharacterized protein n=1 Tax=Rotaria socialis TaxID=392032 RepID=A0A820LEQ0_9BILA|nr:unnamed protein product [Rotaria socialis]CAF3561677.1 unnamed protein product [Rotaria socialis]CAF4218470.1 unnamed protein product [Rotaria socialis]CAF4355684.1 unnamed protein product [Rotaria socialis]